MPFSKCLALLGVLAGVVVPALASAPQCTTTGARCAGAPGKPFVQYAPCCTAGMKCLENPSMGWGRFCVEYKKKVVSGKCYKAGERCMGAPLMPYVHYHKCCDGTPCVTDAAMGWGGWCKGKDYIPPKKTEYRAPTKTKADYTPKKCYSTGERCMGAHLMPYVFYKPCCDGSPCLERPSKGYGGFCLGYKGHTYTPPPRPHVYTQPKPHVYYKNYGKHSPAPSPYPDHYYGYGYGKKKGMPKNAMPTPSSSPAGPVMPTPSSSPAGPVMPTPTASPADPRCPVATTANAAQSNTQNPIPSRGNDAYFRFTLDIPLADVCGYTAATIPLSVMLARLGPICTQAGAIGPVRCYFVRATSVSGAGTTPGGNRMAVVERQAGRVRGVYEIQCAPFLYNLIRLFLLLVTGIDIEDEFVPTAASPAA